MNQFMRTGLSNFSKKNMYEFLTMDLIHCGLIINKYYLEGVYDGHTP